MSLSDLFESQMIANPDRKVIEVAQSVLNSYGIQHVCYFSKSFSTSSVELATNYPTDWIAHYNENDYYDVDPVLAQTWEGHRPVNWLDVNEKTRDIRDFFGAAKEFGVGKSGLTIPIGNCDNCDAYFSISSDMTQKEWIGIFERHNLDFRNFAFLFHIYYVQSEKEAKFLVPSLSERELQVLSWAAAGKSAWETSQILGLSQRTIDFYIKNCMLKFDVTNKTHAVAMAVNFNLIETDHFLTAQYL